MRHFVTYTLFLLCAIAAWGQDASQYLAEAEGLDQPVVVTTDASQPVLYRIQCGSNGRFIKAGKRKVGSGWFGSQEVYGLCQTDKLEDATDFYFVASGKGVSVFTADGYYVSNAEESYYDSPAELKKGKPSSKEKPWEMDFFADKGNPGYRVFYSIVEDYGGYVYEETLYWRAYNNDYVGTSWDGDEDTFLFYSADPRHIEMLKANGGDLGQVPKGNLADLVGDITLDGRPMVYDAAGSSYLYSLPQTLRGGGDLTAVCGYAPGEGGYSLAIADQPVAPGESLTLSGVDCAKTYAVVVRDAEGTPVLRSKLSFTFLPIVEVNASYVDGKYYNIGTLRVSYDPADDDDDDESGNSQLLEAAYKYRGATAQRFDKKSYAVKLRTRKGVSYERKFFGFRNDNNWILDAACIDPSLMRNRVATDLWNDYSHKPYYKDKEKNERTGTRGRFVEVFLNGSYHGLYCMTEKLDRKQVKAVKQEKADDGTTVQHGSVYKSTDWKYEVFMGHELDVHSYPRTLPEDYQRYNDEGLELWRGWEIKYPDFETQRIDWGPLYNCVNFTATLGGTKFDNGFDTYWDMDQVKDYYLLIELLLATDNHGKNMYLVNYDQQAETDAAKMAIGVWDLDGTFGIRWDGSTWVTGPDQDYDKFLWANEHGNHTLFYRLRNSKLYNWPAILAKRYAKLRHTYFDPESLKERFEAYRDLFAESRADLREERKWGKQRFLNAQHDNIGRAVDEAVSWLEQRVAYLDSQYAYDPDVDPDTMIDAIESAAPDASSTLALRSGRGCLYVRADAPTTVTLHNAAGQTLLVRDVPAGVSTIGSLAAGIYVVNGKKVIVQ